MQETAARPSGGSRYGFLLRAWGIIKPYWYSEERWRARGLLALIIALELGTVGITVLLANWNQEFFNALQGKNEADFYSLLWKFSGLAAVFIVAAVYSLYFTQMLQIRWRRWLTDRFNDTWLSDRSYYLLQFERPDLENPEQRVQDDIGVVVSLTLNLTIGFLNSLVTLVSFIAMLWGLSGALPIALGGFEFSIPGYMVWVALLYAGLGTLATHFIGRRLVRINFDLQKYNADFRYGMIRVREYAESVALYRGEVDEGTRLRGAFGNIWQSWWQLMRTQKQLTFFTSAYGQLASVFPLVVAAPRYFTGAIPLGVLTQTAFAFGQVQGSLSWFIGAYTSLAEWTASTGRLIGFQEALDQVKRVSQESDLRVEAQTEPAVSMEGVDVGLPRNRPLLDRISLTIDKGERLLVTGPSGSGKSTLFRVLAGIWPYGDGVVRVPSSADVLFLPQKPYLPQGTLAEVLSYPRPSDAFVEERLRAALVDCRLPHLQDRLAEHGNWSLQLSVGEQQRIGFARALLHQPQWLFLDEATSALDAPTEDALYRMLTERLPAASIVSIAHKPEIARFHQRRVTLDPATRSLQPWNETPQTSVAPGLGG